MPIIPDGVTSCTVTFGKAFGFRTDSGQVAGSIELVLTADHDIVHAASGYSFNSIGETITAAEGAVLSFQVPQVDQDGFIDGHGNAIKHWNYNVKGKVRFTGTSEVRTVDIDFGPLVGQPTLDLDLVPNTGPSTPVQTPTQYVTDVAGLPGSVSAEDLVAALQTLLSDSYVARQDTGWRDITGLFDEALPAATFLIRRDTINGARLSINPGQNGVNLHLYSGNPVPDGFGCTTDSFAVSGYPFILTDEGGSLTGVGMMTASQGIQFQNLPDASDPNNIYASCAVSWPCAEDWPTALPGTAFVPA